MSITLAERGLVPEPIIRVGIRRLLSKRLRDEALRHHNREGALTDWVAAMSRAPIAPVPYLANAQHYEVPAELFEIALGRQLKYSSGYWPTGVQNLDDAEEAMLALTAERAGLADGQRILELGCGWGSLSLWMARHYPNAQITAVSNSRSQRAFIESRALAQGLSNVVVLTADVNEIELPERAYDRVVSVEMFEHLRNWSGILARLRRWIVDDGQLFIHVFAHRLYAYPFESIADDDWMGRHFFSGGMMPSADLFERIDSPFRVAARHEVSGIHYARTAEAWRDNLVARAADVEALFARDLGRVEGKLRYERWKMFFLACAELFGYCGGTEWVVSQNLLVPKAGGGGR